MGTGVAGITNISQTGDVVSFAKIQKHYTRIIYLKNKSNLIEHNSHMEELVRL